MEIKETTIKINGMMCNGCEETVVNAVKTVEGVESASASHEQGTATISYDSEKTDPLFINMAINNTHYKIVE